MPTFESHRGPFAEGPLSVRHGLYTNDIDSTQNERNLSPLPDQGSHHTRTAGQLARENVDWDRQESMYDPPPFSRRTSNSNKFANGVHSS
jgi:hypothetical protein